MCRCGLRCDYIDEALEYTGRDKKGYQCSVGQIITDDEVNDTKTQEGSFIPP